MSPFLSIRVSDIVVLATVSFAALFITRTVYNLFFHPLAKFPGPLLYRASVLPFVYQIFRGTSTFDILPLVEKYGPIVRITPNELVFIDVDAWKDIYSQHNGAIAPGAEFSKFRLFYRTKGLPASLLSETRENHALLRRQLAQGFSKKSLREQEPIIGGYVDMLIRQLKARCVDNETVRSIANPTAGTFDMRTWYTWTTFDVIGDLALGEPFGCLERAEPDAWVTSIEQSLRGADYMTCFKHLGLESVMLSLMRKLMSYRKVHEERTMAKLKRRMALTMERPDFIEGLLKKKEDWNLTLTDLRVNAGLLIVAGSETTATLLSGVTYLLLSNPHTLERLVDEVRSSYRADDEITLTSVGNLKYMHACLSEAARIYPPVAGPLPRVVPKGGANIAGTFVPEDTVVAAWQWPMYHSTRNFSDPFSYKPERFLEPEKFPGDKMDALQPFSVGPRNCIGKNLAYAEMRLILARIIFNFDMELVDKKSDWLDQPVYFFWKKKSLFVRMSPVAV